MKPHKANICFILEHMFAPKNLEKIIVKNVKLLETSD